MWKYVREYWFLLIVIGIVFLLLPAASDARIDVEKYTCPASAIIVELVDCDGVEVVVIEFETMNWFEIKTAIDALALEKMKLIFKQNPYAEVYYQEADGCQ